VKKSPTQGYNLFQIGTCDFGPGTWSKVAVMLLYNLPNLGNEKNGGSLSIT
jgi:hypothetical protein